MVVGLLIGKYDVMITSEPHDCELEEEPRKELPEFCHLAFQSVGADNYSSNLHCLLAISLVMAEDVEREHSYPSF